MKTIRQNNITFVNLDTVTNVFIWHGQLTASLSGAVDDIVIGDVVFALRGGKIVAAGRITELQYHVTYQSPRDRKGHISKRWVRMNLHTAANPATLSKDEVKVLRATAAEYGCPYPKFQDVLAIPKKNTGCFESLMSELYCLSRHVHKPADRAHSKETIHLLGHADIKTPIKVKLCQALGGNGEIKKTVLERDEHRIDSDHELDLVATRIVPWEACSNNEMRLDPDNYVLMDEQLAEHFNAGLVTFQDDGVQVQDPAMDEDAFDPWVDLHFCLPELTQRQKEFLAYHRKHVFKQWRNGAPKPMCALGK
jgi:hypothetical protein